MIVRLTHDDGHDTETIVSTTPYPSLTADDLARALLAGLDGVTRVRVWTNGSFLDAPTADLSRADAPITATLTPELLDVATLVMLAIPRQDRAPEPPARPWRPYAGPGRPPASGRIPPV
jgi:hypothetical protein